MEKLSEDNQFGMADDVEAEVIRDGEVLENEIVDEAVDNANIADNVKVEINPQ